MKPSCLRCASFFTCKEPMKSHDFSCSRISVVKSAASVHEAFSLSLEEAFELDEKENSHLLAASDSMDVPDDLPDDFVWKAMQDAFDPHTNTVRDLVIDDRDLPMAQNFFDYSKNVVGGAMKLPFARQLWIATMLMGEACPICSDPEYFKVETAPVDMDPHDLVDGKRLQLLHHGVCPSCGVKKSALFSSEKLVNYGQLVLVAGQRAGKSALSSSMATYLVHRYLKIPRISTMCGGIQDFTPLTCTFVALTATKSIKLLWSPFKMLMDESQWFKDYFAMLNHFGSQYGKEFYKRAELFTKFYHKNIEIGSMGPMKRTLRGDTRLFTMTDELGLFPFSVSMNDDGEMEEEADDRERANGDEVHQSLDNSLATIRVEVHDLHRRGIDVVPNGFNINLSSPFSWNDKICRLLRESEEPEALSLGVHLPTWEINPRFSRDHPIIRAAYAKNAIRAERDYGANPPALTSSVFEKDKVVTSFVGKQHHAIAYDTSMPGFTSGKVVDKISRASWPPTALAIDAGLKNNSFGLALGYREGPTVKVASALEIIPQPGTEINFPLIYQNIIKPLIRLCNVTVLAADRWNSIHLLQQAALDSKDKCLPIQVTMNARLFSQYSSLVATSNLELPEMELEPDRVETVTNYKREMLNYPVSHLFLQFLSVRNEQGVFIKGDGYTDDVFRAVSVLASALFLDKVVKHMAKYQKADRPGISDRAFVVSRGNSAALFRG
jgi:hypothetical protein